MIQPFERIMAHVEAVASAIGPLRERLVFVGGCAVSLLVTQVRAQPIRMTADVDLVAEISTLSEFIELEKQFRSLGFNNDLSANAPICRWRKGDLIVDLLPSNGTIFGFHNRWYVQAVQSAVRTELPDKSHILLIGASAFIATKIEAFKSRGKGDFLASHDLEDIITLVDARESLLTEIAESKAELRIFLAETARNWLADPNFMSSLPAHLPPDSASQKRLTRLIHVLNSIAVT